MDAEKTGCPTDVGKADFPVVGDGKDRRFVGLSTGKSPSSH